ncbi:MAG: bifunctional riboflavin kinase/FAD synthetase [Flavobacteriales bacterium]
MKVYCRLQDFKKLERAVVTTGTFDGVHLGHQTILKRLKEIAAREKAETVVLTFDPHPRIVIYNDTNIRLITTLPEKIALLEKEGIDHLIVIPFTKEFSRISSIDFIRNILVGTIGTSRLVIGYNHLFGRNREGSFEHLMEYGPVYGFEVEEIPAKEIDSVDISSTKIREALEVGNVALANKYLGHPFSLNGKVIEGNKKGRTIGFPTANIEVGNQHKMIPGIGVYAVKLTIDGKEHGGMMNIGYRPTIQEEGNVSIEVHVFDFSGDLYGRELEVLPLKKIRDEQKFASLDKLKEQLNNDKVKSLEILQ